MSNYWTWYWVGDGVSWQTYLRQKSLVDDVGRGQDQIASRLEGAISGQTRDILGSLEGLGSRLREGFAGLGRGLADLNATFTWGFNEVLAAIGHMQDSLEQLIRIAKTPAQTASYEHFEIARNAFRQRLFPECLEALGHATDGVAGVSSGYRLEWRFHHLRGLVLLGSFENTSETILDPAKAEQAFLLAARYARADEPVEAAKAMLGAGWAAYLQAEGRAEKLRDALAHSEEAARLDPALSEAHFQVAKVRMALDDPDGALPSLGRAGALDGQHVVKAAADGDFKRHDEKMREFLASLGSQVSARVAREASVQMERLSGQPPGWQTLLRAEQVVKRLASASEGGPGWSLPDHLDYEREGFSADCASFDGDLRVLDDLSRKATEVLGGEDVAVAPSGDSRVLLWRALASREPGMAVGVQRNYLDGGIDRERKELLTQYVSTLEMTLFTAGRSQYSVTVDGRTADCRPWDHGTQYSTVLYLTPGTHRIRCQEEAGYSGLGRRYQWAGTMTLVLAGGSCKVWLPKVDCNGQVEAPEARENCQLESFKLDEGQGTGCFPADTPVRVPGGWASIARITKGDTVLTADVRHGGLRPSRVLRAVAHSAQPLLELRLAGDRLVRTTSRHSFLSDGRWVPAGRLAEGCSIAVAEESGAIVQARLLQVVRTARKEPVYNLVVAGGFSFVAGGAVAHCFTFLRGPRTVLWRTKGLLGRIARKLGRLGGQAERASSFAPAGQSATGA